ncbi:MAG: DNA polymerase III subunit gamma/tau [Candidatus Brennerbacteria bacterium]|nr:DNA polymerase III subunit gamma/tau [Candidatus Brennerbacteria bacterium]
MSLSIYRKYRPKTFDDLLGQPTIIQILKNAGRLNKIGHAYLLSGPRGTGKTTAARLIAKTANCETRRQNPKFQALGEPCNECRICREINEGRALDIVEIDAASNRGIDEIRNLKDATRVAPTSYLYKVFIIDEAHMLTKEAFNALLKTLEEPPSHVILIMATTEMDKIPGTIASRTQRFHFKRASVLQIIEKLKKIVEIEAIKIDNDAIELVAAAAEGSFRDAESLLEQMLNFGSPVGEEKISLRDVEQMIGKTGSAKVAAFAEKLLKKDIEGALNALNEIQEGGYNLAQFCKDLIHHLRRTLVLKLNPAMDSAFQNELAKNDLENLKKQTAYFQPEKHIQLLKNLINAYGQMRYSPFPVIPLEVAIAESLKL